METEKIIWFVRFNGREWNFPSMKERDNFADDLEHRLDMSAIRMKVIRGHAQE